MDRIKKEFELSQKFYAERSNKIKEEAFGVDYETFKKPYGPYKEAIARYMKEHPERVRAAEGEESDFALDDRTQPPIRKVNLENLLFEEDEKEELEQA